MRGSEAVAAWRRMRAAGVRMVGAAAGRNVPGASRAAGTGAVARMGVAALVVACVAATWTATASAQSAPAPATVSFEVASVKAASPDEPQHVQAGLHVDGAQIHVLDYRLVDLIRIAYNLKFYQVSAPDWAASDRWDIDAKLPDGANRDQVPEMLQNLLATRFQMVAHTERKNLAVYALIQAPGGARLQASTAPVPAGADAGGLNAAGSGGPEGVNLSLPGGGQFSMTPDQGMVAHNMTMASMADYLGRFVSRGVVDQTHLAGRFDFTAALTEDEYNSMLIQAGLNAGVALPPGVLARAGGADSALNDALKPLGLRLQSQTAPVSVLVVDRLSKTPTGN